MPHGRRFPMETRADDGAGPEALPPVSPRYIVLGRLGAGGMGVVYRAVDETLNRTVAIKWVTAGHRDAKGNARLLREARAAAAIVHPNAIGSFDVAEATDGSVF